MKQIGKKKIVALMIFLLLAVIVYLLPHAIDVNRFRSIVENRASGALKADISLKGLEFRWTPLPHILIFDVKAENKDIELDAPYIGLFPKWSSLLTGKLHVSQIVLNAPSLFIKGTGFLKKDESGKKSPPLGKVIIHHGSLRMSGKDVCSKILCEKKDLIFKEIDGSIELAADNVKWDIEFEPSFAAEFRSAGTYFLDKKVYTAQVNISQWRPHALFLKAWEKYGLKPVDSMVNLQAKVRGTVNGAMSVSLSGDMPCLTARPKNKEIMFSCGYFKMDVHKRHKEIWAHIDQLYLEDPAISLSGKVEARLPERKGAKPFLKAELTANDADIASIRSKALSLFGRHKDVREVFAIVRGGKAIYAKILFEGTADKVSKVENYRLEALVKDAGIKIPKVDLHLKGCEGDIKIDKAILTGTDLRGETGGSSFKNGTLELALKGRDKMLKAEFDAHAQVEDVVPILKKVIKDEKFQQELSLFEGLKGKASGRVWLGNSVKHLRPQINVKKLECKGSYKRFSWQVAIKKGQATITGNSVAWKGVAGRAGRHEVYDTSGKVTWGKGKDIFLNIKSLSATLDGAALLSELNDYESIRKELKKVVTKANGSVTIRKARLKGPAKRPKEWSYSIPGTAKKVTFSSPMLPDEVFLYHYPFHATHRRIKGGASKLRLAQQDYNLAVDFLHKDFKPLKLDLSLSGSPGPVLLKWVKEKKWIPEAYFPRCPEKIEDLHVLWKKGEKYLSVETRAYFPSAGGTISVDLSLAHKPDFLHLKRLHISSSKDSATLELTAKGSLVKASWSGSLRGTTVDEVLEKNILLKGGLAGEARVVCDYSASSPNLDFNGSLELRNFSWIWGVEPSLTIYRGRLDGSGSVIHLVNGQIGVGKGRAQVEGVFRLKGAAIFMDLESQADQLTFKDLELFLSSFNSKGKKKEGPYVSVTGKVKFQLGQFSWPFKGKDREVEEPKVYNFQNVIGAAQLLGHGEVKVDVDQAQLCAIDLKGNWLQKGSEEQLDFTFYLPHEKKQRFEKLLSCLGFEQDLMEGDVAFSGSIKGRPGRWSGGEINLVSRDGTLRKLTLLAKLFSLLNVTDLFSSRGLPDLFTEGLKYSELGLHGVVQDNKMIFDNIYVKGQGLNMYASGELDMASFDLNGLILVSPFKTIDAIVSKVPLVSMIIPGESGAVFSVPVKVTGHFKDPKLDIMPARAVTGTIKNILMNTLKFPWKILNFSGNNKNEKAGKKSEEVESGHKVQKEQEEDFEIDLQ